MASAVTWLALVALLTAPAAASFARQGFLLTSPKTFIAGTSERFCITFYRLHGPINLNVYLLPKLNSTSAQSVATFSKNRLRVRGRMSPICFYISVPKKTARGTFYLRASVSTRDGFSSTKTSQINVLSYTLITLVQTDKSKYKAGQMVLFRVVTLKSDLTALEENVKQIFITTPANTRLAQWDNVNTQSGIIQRKFTLTQEPPLGMWTIHVKRGDRITRQTFEVAEFTLPRFEVTITGPSYIVKNANTVTLKVCAKYTFGKPVSPADVVLYAERTVPRYFYRRRTIGAPIDTRGTVPSNITLEDASDSAGCAEFDILLANIGVGKEFESRGIYVSRVNFKANVTEAGTALVLGSDLSIPIQTPRISIEIDRKTGNRFIKPNLHYIGYATVKGADGEPLVREVLEVCHKETYRDQGDIKPIIKNQNDDHYFPYYKSQGRVALSNRAFFKLPIIHHPVSTKNKDGGCREYTSDKNGRIRFSLPKQLPGIISSNVNIRTKRKSSPSGSSSISLKGWFSLTNSFISIVPVTDPSVLKCGDDFKLKVESTVARQAMTYLVMARGQIDGFGPVYSGGLITIPINFRVSPSFKVLVYYVNSLGETIADSKTFDVANCFQNQVKVAWNKKTVEPGQQATLTVTGSPNSLCGVSAVDRSVELLSDKNKLTAKNVFAKLRQFIISEYASPRLVTSDRSYCARKARYSGGYYNFPGQYNHAEADINDAEKEILEPGRIIPAPLPPRPAPGYEIYYNTVQDDTIKAFDVAGYLPLTNLVLESRPCERRNRTRYYRRYRGGPVFSLSKGAAGPQQFLMASVQDTSALAAPAAESSSAPVETAVRSLFPETFLFSLKALGSQGKVAITRKMPDTITSWVASAFCSGLHSGFGLSESASITTFKPFFAQIQVPYSVKRGEVLRLKISVFNFLSQDLSVVVELASSSDYSVVSGGNTRSICVRASKPSVVDFPVEFSSLGKIGITVEAKTSGSACGAPNSKYVSDKLIRTLIVKPEGFPQEEVQTGFLCKKDGNPNVPLVESFDLALPKHLVPDSQRSWVNVVGDLIAPSAGNLERLVRVPTGCGEQNMIGFVPNILVRRYLAEVKLLTDSLKDRTTANMATGYQRELRYRRRDGSYSAFPERSPPRYKGSLWLTAYVVRSYVAASRYIAIDKADLTISTKWIVGKQGANGAFKPFGDLFHKEMRGGVGNGADEAMTAFVTLALLDAGDQKSAVDKAVAFLLGTTSFSTLYAEILVAHVLVAAGKTTEGAARVTTLLAKGTRKGGQLYWQGDRSSKVGGSRAVDVEMTAYMVLTLLKLSGSANLGEAALAIKWVNAQRNSRGGFVSTQDTVVALTALTEFAIATYSPTMAVSVDVSALPNFQYNVQVTAANRLLTRQKSLPSPLQLANRVTFSVTGTGCAVVQSVFRYNTKVAFPDPKFNLNAVITKIKKSCSFTLKVCTSFKEANKESNMAIVEIEMVSGFVTIDRSLRDLEKNNVIERWEFKEDKASLYFDKFSTKEVCFDVRFIRASDIEKLKPAVVRVYDYYAHEDRFEVEYGPPDCPK